PPPLPATPAPAVGTRVPAGDGRPLRGLARGHRDRTACGRGLSREPRHHVWSYSRPNCLRRCDIALRDNACMRTHRTHTCRLCGDTTYTPPLGSACRRTSSTSGE